MITAYNCNRTKDILEECTNVNIFINTFVSHPCHIKHKALFLKIELNAFSNSGHIYGHCEKKLFKYLEN